MKKLLTILACLGAIYASAQTSLTDANMPFGPQAVKPVMANVAGVTVPAAGANAVWNYASLVQQQVMPYGYVTPSSPYFTTATYEDTSIAINFIANTVFYSNFFYEENTNYVAAIGTAIPFQHYNIAAQTGGANDSCIFPTQHLQFDNPAILLKYPTTMSSAWHTTYTDVVNFQLSIAQYFLNHTPCKRVTHITKLDTVVGWGKVIVPTALGPSTAYDALMLKRQSVSVDSFYLNGIAAPQALLTAFGLTQGQLTTSNRYLFWRPNSDYPIMIFNFGANNFTTPSSIIYDGFAQLSGINEFSSLSNVSVFPNPAQNKVYITGSGNSQITIYDITGKIILSIDKAGEMETLNTSSLERGMYFVRITNNKESITQKLMIQ